MVVEDVARAALRSQAWSVERAEPRTEHRPGDSSDVKRYLFRLLALIGLGAALMGGIATWAWQKYASGYVDTTRPAPMPPQRP
jgi:hypothetical protein